VVDAAVDAGRRVHQEIGRVDEGRTFREFRRREHFTERIEDAIAEFRLAEGVVRGPGAIDGSYDLRDRRRRGGIARTGGLNNHTGVSRAWRGISSNQYTPPKHLP